MAVIKLDCQRSELAVLTGAAETIRQNRPVLFVEVPKWREVDCPVLAWAPENGYDVRQLQGYDFIMLPAEAEYPDPPGGTEWQTQRCKT